MFEGRVRVGDCKGELGLGEIAGEALGEGWGDTDGFVDDIGEFGGMCGGEDEALRGSGVVLAVGFPRFDADSGVGVRNITVAIPDGVHFLQGFRVRDAVSPNLLANIMDAVATEIEEARKIVGIADVHGVRVGGYGGNRTIFAAEQILRDDIVGVGSGDETSHRQTDALGEDPGGEVAEIAAGHSDDQRDGGHGKLAVGGDVIEHLREQATDIDGIRGSEEGALIELLVGESLLDEALAIVKGAGNFEGGDIVAERGELFFLGFADALRRIEDHDPNAGNAKKAVCDGTAGVAGSSDENGELARFVANEIAHKAGHETGSEIFKGQRRPVEQFQDVKRGRKRNEFDGKIDGFGDDLPEGFLGDIGRGEGANDAEAHFGERQAAEFFEFLRSVACNFGRHVEATVGSETTQDRTSKRGKGSFADGGAVAHGKKLSVIRFAFRNGTLYVVLTGYVEMLRGAKGTSARLREKENGNWQNIDVRVCPEGKPLRWWTLGPRLTPGRKQCADFVEEQLGDVGVAGGAGGREFAGDCGGDGEMGEGFVALTASGDEYRVATDHGVARRFARTRLEDPLPEDRFGIVEITFDEQLRLFGRRGEVDDGHLAAEPMEDVIARADDAAGGVEDEFTLRIFFE